MKRLFTLVLAMMLALTGAAFAEGERNILASPLNSWVEEVVDLGGRTIKIGSWWIDAYDYWEEAEETPSDVLERIQVLKEIEADYNCKIELVDLEGIESYTQELAEQFAMAKTSGDTLCDIIDWQNNFNPGPAVYANYLAPLDDIPIMKANIQNFSPISYQIAYEGKVYGLNDESPLGYMRSMLVFNKDYVAEYGIEDLYQLAREKKWTFDKFMEVCEKVYSQSGGTISAIVKRYGMPETLLTQFMTSNNAVPFTQIDGKLVAQHNTEASVRACQFVVDMINKKLLDMDYIANPGDPYEYFIAGQSMFYIAEGWEIGDIAAELSGEMGLLPMPIGPDATDYASYVNGCRMMSIVDNGDGGDAAAHVLIAMKKRCADFHLDFEDEPTEEELTTPFDWIIDDLSWDLSDEDSQEMAQLIFDGLTMDYFLMLQDVPGWGEASAAIAAGVSTPAEALGAIAAELQAAVDEFNK